MSVRLGLVRFAGVALWIALMAIIAPVGAETPSFDCNTRLSDAKTIICSDTTLAALDRKLGEIVTRAMHAMPQDKVIAYFVAEQQEWVRDRDGCPTARDPKGCLSSVYRTRIAELQDRFHMVPSRGPFRFACDGKPPQEIVVTWYATDPPSGILESARGQTTMFATVFDNGTRYISDDVTFTESQGTAAVAWGAGTPTFACTLMK